MRKLYFYLPLLICLIFVAKSVLAQDLNVDFSKVGNWIGEFLGIPRNLMTTSKVFRYVMLPFLAVFIAVLGIMRDIMLFRRSRHLDWILALLISFIILPWSGAMGWLILWLYGTGGVLSVTVVGLLILFGAIMFGVGGGMGIFRRYTSEFREVKDMNKHLDGLQKDLSNLRRRYYTRMRQNAGPDELNRIERQMNELEGKIRDIRQRI
jgi:hypothetical protein